MDAMLIQGTEEWRQARCGSLGASRVADAVAKVKTGTSASRTKLMGELIAERMTGVPAETFVNGAMQWGTDNEARARKAYAFYANVDVVEVGLLRHPRLHGTHASPDGLVADDGMVEIKCPNSSTHADTILSGKVPERYVTQMQWQMACSDRAWCDFVSFDPRMRIELRIFVKRVSRDDLFIARLEKDVGEFLNELDEKIAALEAIAARSSRLRQDLTKSLNILAAG